MKNKAKFPFKPDYTVLPGETLAETLEAKGMTQKDLAARTDLTPKHINKIIKGESPITPATALAFERVLGVDASFWNNLEKNHQERSARIKETKELESSIGWMRKFPIKDMVKNGWLGKFDDEIEQLKALLNHFGISSPSQWGSVFAKPQASFRKSATHPSKPEPLSAWLRQGEIEARKLRCKSYDADKFGEIQTRLRDLTRETDPRSFIAKLRNDCAECGVAVVFVPEVPGTCVFGVTKWLGDKALIQLSLRQKANDIMWFTFFHEAGHIILHGKKESFLENNGPKDAKEKEADAYAANLLIPPKSYRKFVKTGNFSAGAVQKFALEMGIAPAIVVGRLHHEEKLPYNQLTGFKVYYKFASNN